MSTPTKLSELTPDEQNPRTISPEHLQALKTSISSFGDISGIVWNRRTGHLVAGHQRVRGLQELHGDLHIEGDEIVTPTGERFRVRIVEWDEAQERAANVAANSPSLMGEFTDDLGDLLAAIGEQSPTLYEGLLFGELDPIADVDLSGPEVQTQATTPAEERRAFSFTLPLAKADVIDRAFTLVRGGRREKRLSDDEVFVEVCERVLAAEGE